MTVTLLPCEIAELKAVRNAVSQEVFNGWFDQSKIKARIKKAYMQHQQLRCCYCKKFTDSAHSAHWEIEHVLCEDLYPQFFADLENLALACSPCNNAKSATDVYAPPPRSSLKLTAVPTSPDLYTIPHPNFDTWDTHLGHVDFKVYFAKDHSPRGTQLLSVCKLNKKAIDGSGLSYESVVTALRTKFFEIMQPLLDVRPTDTEVVAIMSRFTAGDHDRAAALTLKDVSRSLATQEREARRRSHEKSVADAQLIGQDMAAKKAAKEAEAAKKLLKSPMEPLTEADLRNALTKLQLPKAEPGPETLLLPAPEPGDTPKDDTGSDNAD